MGANFFYSEMLPTVDVEAKGVKNPKRQLEVFTHGGKRFLRVGPVGVEHAAEGRATVELSEKEAESLIAALKP